MIALPNTSNLIGSATLTVSSEDSAYPKANLALLPISKTFRTTGSSPASSQTILMDFGSAQSVDLVAVINHNLSSTATITVRAGTTTGVSDFSQSITWRERTVYAVLTSLQSYRYWRIDLNDPFNTNGFLEIGYISIGNSTSYSFGPLYGTLVSTDEFVNSEDESEFGAPHVSEIFNRTNLSFDLRTVADNEDLIHALFRSLKRNVTPLFLIIDSDIYDGYFGRFINNPDRTIYRIRGQDGYREVSFDFREDGIGRRIPA